MHCIDTPGRVPRFGIVGGEPTLSACCSTKETHDHPRMHVEASHVAIAPWGPGGRREGLVTVVDGLESAWQDRQLAQAERTLQAGIDAL
jgi:hypothetical protein